MRLAQGGRDAAMLYHGRNCRCERSHCFCYARCSGASPAAVMPGSTLMLRHDVAFQVSHLDGVMWEAKPPVTATLGELRRGAVAAIDPECRWVSRAIEGELVSVPEYIGIRFGPANWRCSGGLPHFVVPYSDEEGDNLFDNPILVAAEAIRGLRGLDCLGHQLFFEGELWEFIHPQLDRQFFRVESRDISPIGESGDGRSRPYPIRWMGRRGRSGLDVSREEDFHGRGEPLLAIEPHEPDMAYYRRDLACPPVCMPNTKLLLRADLYTALSRIALIPAVTVEAQREGPAGRFACGVRLATYHSVRPQWPRSGWQGGLPHVLLRAPGTPAVEVSGNAIVSRAWLNEHPFIKFGGGWIVTHDAVWDLLKPVLDPEFIEVRCWQAQELW